MHIMIALARYACMSMQVSLACLQMHFLFLGRRQSIFARAVTVSIVRRIISSDVARGRRRYDESALC